MEHFLDAFKKYADFSGRATRTQYWMFVLFYFIISIVLNVVDAFLFIPMMGLPILSILFGLGIIIPSISVAVRRLHDTSRTGWWLLIALLPVIGVIVLIIFYVMDSHGDNVYGPNPAASA